MREFTGVLIWSGLIIAVCAPLALAALSPLHAWRSAVYVVGSLSGVVALGLMLAQPLLAGGYLSGLSGHRGRRAHAWIGGALVIAVAAHVGGLWIASPPDMIDALLFSSPTPFSAWGVAAMWAMVAVALLALLRRRLAIAPRTWRLAHVALAAVVVSGSVVHAVLIEGAMETVSKAILCAAVVAAAAKVMIERRVWRKRRAPGLGNVNLAAMKDDPMR
jgi:predicted ferric reductase